MNSSDAKKDTTSDKDLYEGLQQARKKKARYYALIARGAEVVGLIVQKKVINDSTLQNAKSKAKGNLVIQGVCCGEGVELKFEVLGEEPTIQPKKIKDFIEEQTDLSIKAQWSVVTMLTPVIDEDNLAPSAANQVTKSTAENQSPTSTDSENLKGRLKSLLLAAQGMESIAPADREALLQFAKAASAAVTMGSADARLSVDKLEQAITLIGRRGQTAPPRPNQGPDASVVPPQRPSQGPTLNQQPPPRPAQGPQPPRPVAAAPQRPGQGPPGTQQTANPSSKRESLFDRAKQRIKNFGRDTEKQAIFEEIRCSSALDNIGFAIDKLARDTPQATAPQVADFSHQQMELQLKLQNLWNATQVDPKEMGAVRKAAEVLERQVLQYVQQSANSRQTLHEFAERLQNAKDTLQQARDEAKKYVFASEHIEIVETYTPLIDAAQKDYDLAIQELDSTGEIGPVASKSLASHDKSFEMVGTFVVARVSAALQARRAAMLDRAQNDPSSDAARLAKGLGGLPGLTTFMGNILVREQQMGTSLSKLARDGETLTDEELVGLWLYTDDAYEDMNGHLLFPETYVRQKYPNAQAKTEQIKIMNEFCQRGLSKLPDYPSICYPVIRFESGNYDWEKIYVEGQTFRNKQFWSTGATTGAWIKNPQKACLLFRIYGKTGKDVATFAKNQEGFKELSVPQLAALGKGEVLFAPGTSFKVMAVVEDENQMFSLPTFNITLIEQ